jgi:hypothetical protein
MPRPPDLTALSRDEASYVRDLVRRGKAQYDLNWRDVALAAHYGERAARNYMSRERPLPRRVAAALICGMIDAEKARAWREAHGCSPRHRTGEAMICPCDPWSLLVSIWLPTRQWLKRKPVPALFAPEAIDAFAEELAQFLCSAAGLGLGHAKRESSEKVVRRFLNRNAERFAGDAVAVMGFSYFPHNAATTISDAGQVLTALREHLRPRASASEVSNEERLDALTRTYKERTVREAATSYWPHVKIDEGVSSLERLKIASMGMFE